jgi:hypothetical protein
MRAAIVTSAATAVTMILSYTAGATGIPNGSYASLPSASEADCVRACDQDALCMAWTFTEHTCALRATAPAFPLTYGALSARAIQAGLPLDAKDGADAPAAEPIEHDTPPQDVEAGSLLGGPGPEAPSAKSKSAPQGR